MYSLSWFETFARTVPAKNTAAEVDAVGRFAPPSAYPRLLDVGCGTGRAAAPLAERGYRVTGLDTSAAALRAAARAAPRATFVALDQRHIGQLRWRFDVVLILWNSFGFGTRSEDLGTLRGIRSVLRPGGRCLLDLYHPEWLAAHAQSNATDERGASIDRWVEGGRCMHEIRYPGGQVDHISFNIYRPDEMISALTASGFAVEPAMAWWDPDTAPAPQLARYQVIAAREA